MSRQLKTIRGYDFYEVTSALQKSIRRSETKLACYWAVELFYGGYHHYVWKRLLTISAEDCWGIITQEVEALRQAFLLLNEKRGRGKWQGELFIVKAAMILSECKKSRDPDNFLNLIYKKHIGISDDELKAYLEEVREEPEEIPDCALDVHTRRGRMKGKTKKDFFIEEDEALKPRQQGLFDFSVEELKRKPAKRRKVRKS